MMNQLTAKQERPPCASRSVRGTAAPTSATKRQRPAGTQRSELGLVQPRTEPSRSATRVEFASPHGQHVRHTATRQTAMRSAGASSPLKGDQGRYPQMLMNSFQKKARAFFREGEYDLCIKEILYLHAHGITPDPDTAPYGFMLYLHDAYGVARDEMVIVDGKLEIYNRAVKYVAQQRLQDSDVTPEFHDQIMDLIDQLGRAER